MAAQTFAVDDPAVGLLGGNQVHGHSLPDAAESSDLLISLDVYRRVLYVPSCPG